MIPLMLHRQHRVAAAIAALMMAADAAAQNCNEEPRAERKLLVSLADRKLALVENGSVVKVYDVAVGAKASPTPAGAYQIVTRIPDPTWYGPKQVVQPGKRNPLGTRWMGLSAPLVGIHGTPDAASIGYSASHGCIRMLIPQVEWLFERVEIGTPVFIVAA